jgi:hypothetical protein
LRRSIIQKLNQMVNVQKSLMTRRDIGQASHRIRFPSNVNLVPWQRTIVIRVGGLQSTERVLHKLQQKQYKLGIWWNTISKFTLSLIMLSWHHTSCISPVTNVG